MRPKVTPAAGSRGFSDKLLRERIELRSVQRKSRSQQRCFFTKVKEELQFIPAPLKGASNTGREGGVRAGPAQERSSRPAPSTPPGQRVSPPPPLLAYLINAKYVDGLPL